MASQESLSFVRAWEGPGFKAESLTPEEGAIYVALCTSHIGPSEAITEQSLGEHLNMGSRRLRKHIESLRQKGIAIVGSKQKPYGVFLANNIEDLERYCKEQTKHALKELRNVAALKRMTWVQFLGQIDFWE